MGRRASSAIAALCCCANGAAERDLPCADVDRMLVATLPVDRQTRIRTAWLRRLIGSDVVKSDKDGGSDRCVAIRSGREKDSRQWEQQWESTPVGMWL